jgi:hypothetical protein
MACDTDGAAEAQGYTTMRNQIQRKGGGTMFLDQIKNFNPDTVGIDELVAMKALAKLVKAEFDTIGENAPEWLENKSRLLTREINGRRADKLAARKRELEAELSRLETPAEKRSRLQKELDAVNAATA